MVAAARHLPDTASQRPTARQSPQSRWSRLIARLGSSRSAAVAESELGYESAHPWVLADLDAGDGTSPARLS